MENSPVSNKNNVSLKTNQTEEEKRKQHTDKSFQDGDVLQELLLSSAIMFVLQICPSFGTSSTDKHEKYLSRMMNLSALVVAFALLLGKYGAKKERYNNIFPRVFLLGVMSFLLLVPQMVLHTSVMGEGVHPNFHRTTGAIVLGISFCILAFAFYSNIDPNNKPKQKMENVLAKLGKRLRPRRVLPPEKTSE